MMHLSCPVLPCPVLPCPVLSCPVLPCPVLLLPLNGHASPIVGSKSCAHSRGWAPTPWWPACVIHTLTLTISFPDSQHGSESLGMRVHTHSHTYDHSQWKVSLIPRRDGGKECVSGYEASITCTKSEPTINCVHTLCTKLHVLKPGLACECFHTTSISVAKGPQTADHEYW